MISHKFEGLTNGETYYTKVFTANPNGRVNNREDVPAVSCVPSSFPGEPTEYVLIDTITESTTFTAPEDGWYQIELFGASGSGGNSDFIGAARGDAERFASSVSGGGGGSGALATSIVPLKKGDSILLDSLAVGETATATITSGYDSSYNHTMTCVSGGNGGNADANYFGPDRCTVGSGGTGGTATGGNVTNINGNKGTSGTFLNVMSKNEEEQGDYSEYYGSSTPYCMRYGSSYYSPKYNNGGAGGTAAESGCRVGGMGGGIKFEYQSEYSFMASSVSAGSGSTAYMKIYRGNTNVVA